jgi:hypothetical protein
MYDINGLIRAVCTIYMTWSETYVRYKWPDQRRMYDINDLIRDVCTICITWSETYVHMSLIRSFISYIRLCSGDVYRAYVSDQVMYIVHTALVRSFDIHDLIRDVCRKYLTWSETYVRYTWPDQRDMHDINDLIRDVCTLKMIWSEPYVRYKWHDQKRMYDIHDLIRDVCTNVSDQVIYIVHTALIRSFISYIRLWSGDVYRTYGSDQIIYIVHMSLIRSSISYIRLCSGDVYRTYVSVQVMYTVHTSLIRSCISYIRQNRMYDIHHLIRAVCTIYMTWSETYVRHKWPDQSRMYDIHDLIRDVCTVYMTMYTVHTSLIRSCISYIRLWSGHVYRTYVSDQVIYIVHTSLIRSFISYIRLWSGHLYRTWGGRGLVVVGFTTIYSIHRH